MSLVSKVALITGSTSGIGLGVARCLAKQGSAIILNGFGDLDEIKKLQHSMMDEYKVKVSFQGADLSNQSEIELMMENCFKEHSKVDIVVNNAGIQHVAPVDEFPTDKWNKIMDLNLNAVHHTTRLVLPKMKEQNWGRIINVAS